MILFTGELTLKKECCLATLYSRWPIPIAAVLINLSIGSVYALSVFNRPINALFPHPLFALFQAPYITFSTCIVITGLSAAFGGSWVERKGPRVASGWAAALFGAGLILGGLGVLAGVQILIWLGIGLIAGVGSGLGYIGPIATLLKWFPDRRGMATGMAVMGFGGGAFIAGFLNQFLIVRAGAGLALVIEGLLYAALMTAGAILIRRAPPNYAPPRYVPKPASTEIAAAESLTRPAALKTFQFYLLWIILFINTTAGVGILAQASPMMQDMFSRTALQAATVVSLISIFNAAGRFFWATVSDYIGRRPTFMIFLLAQTGLFLLIPRFGAAGEWILFESALFVVFSMYGGGFATMPAFAADMFGPANVGGIYGVMLTAWSAAAVVGPLIITQLSAASRASLTPGAPKVHIYDQPLAVLAGVLAFGFILCLLVRPLRSATNKTAS